MSVTDRLSYAALEADVAAILGEVPGPDDSLMDLGLDSMRAMTLVMKWEETVPGIDYARFMEADTLAHWWDVVSEAQG